MRVEPVLLARLGALAARHGLDERQHGQLTTLLSVLAEEQAPTSVSSPGEAVDVHLADSLAALELEQVRAARTLADLGAGAGLPGLPLAIALRETDVRLVESQSRKCLFLESAVARVGLDNGRVVCVRAEEWAAGGERHDVVVARALAPGPVVLEYAAPLLRLGGTLVDWRGRRAPAGEEAAQRAADTLGLRRVEVRRVEPFAGARDHHLHVYEKVEQTPERFPRRPGMARKRPLGALAAGR
ncbi:MAG TPA: 16S rRNA (guanine(527)-N(7))-methyltransferase RsmG [Solirubrobacteraceae bacterium]|jgi:16S rRNA (guanine527-N7)-methyltransferase